MDAVEFFQTVNRLCKNQICAECPICKKGMIKDMCMVRRTVMLGDASVESIEKMISIVEQWAKDNPVKTRNFAVESCRALIKAEPTVTPSPVYAKRVLLDREVRHDLQNAFPKAFLNLRLELIAYPARNTTVPLYGADTLDELNARIIEWCSREACKSNSPASMKYHLNGINQFCHTDFTRDGMEYIYTNLGNGINHDLCLRFVGEMDFNLNKLKHEIEKMEKPT